MIDLCVQELSKCDMFLCVLPSEIDALVIFVKSLYE